MSDSDIVGIVKSTHAIIEEEEFVEEKKEEKKISHKEAVGCFENLLKYFENSSDFNDFDLNGLLKLNERMVFFKAKTLHIQSDLSKFIIKDL